MFPGDDHKHNGVALSLSDIHAPAVSKFLSEWYGTSLVFSGAQLLKLLIYTRCYHALTCVCPNWWQHLLTCCAVISMYLPTSMSVAWYCHSVDHTLSCPWLWHFPNVASCWFHTMGCYIWFMLQTSMLTWSLASCSRSYFFYCQDDGFLPTYLVCGLCALCGLLHAHVNHMCTSPVRMLIPVIFSCFKFVAYSLSAATMSSSCISGGSSWSYSTCHLIGQTSMMDSFSSTFCLGFYSHQFHIWQHLYKHPCNVYCIQHRSISLPLLLYTLYQLF